MEHEPEIFIETASASGWSMEVSDRVERLRNAIESGEYDLPRNLDLAIDRLIARHFPWTLAPTAEPAAARHAPPEAAAEPSGSRG